MTLARMVVLGSVLAVVAGGTGPSLAADNVEVAVDEAAAVRKSRNTANKEGRLELPLPGTPDPKTLPARLAAIGVLPGDPMMIRIFKQESELEIWMQNGAAYTRFAVYPICYFSGSLGPKLRSGDRQAPEGFYTITELHEGGRWPRSLDVGFPNELDQSLGRSGSAILIHGGCNSIGCFAMTNAVNAEIFDLVAAALAAGSKSVPVQIFPFRMTEANLVTYGSEHTKWQEYWSRLKQGYDSFERTHLPPRVESCNRRYVIADTVPTWPAPPPLCAEPAATVVADALVGPPVEAAVGGAGAEAALAQTATVDETPAQRPKLSASKAPRKRAFNRCGSSRPSCRRYAALHGGRATARPKRTYAQARHRGRRVASDD